jgi:arabinosaccharide transport system substrate-binding protein
MPSGLRNWFERLSPGAWTILALAAGSSLAVLAMGKPERTGMPFWVFNKVHEQTYSPFVERWNQDHPDQRVELALFHIDAMERRLMSGFNSDTPVGEILEVERRLAARTLLGPPESVGYLDLTDRLQAEDLIAAINGPSFAPWTVRGRIYGIPHDVHPVLLAYRADLIEAAGIDLTRVETWDELAATLRPLMRDLDGDGKLDRYVLAGWPNNFIWVEVLIRQAEGRFFDDAGRPVLDDAVNVQTLAKIISWTVGPDRFCIEVPDQASGGNKMRRDGMMLCQAIPDWMVGQWKADVPELAGKMKLMPLPAFTKGGRRTSVYGGTMVSISRRARDYDAAWAFAKMLYLSPELAERTFRGTGIITPVKAHWSLPVFAEADPYFSGQASGLAFIAEAPNVPLRSSSPYERLALERTVIAAIDLQSHANATGTFTAAALEPEARRLLGLANDEVARTLDRNVFFAAAPENSAERP